MAGLHGYWALGGQRGWAQALPAAANGQLLMRPSAGLTAAVAVGLLAMSSLNAAYLALGPGAAPGGLRLALGGLALLFTLRMVGDFRYVGLSKRVQHTTFARLDTRYYTPLCGLLAASCTALALAA
ncbi:DUF3995 domain-containing protein [Hymenobacter agri]